MTFGICGSERKFAHVFGAGGACAFCGWPPPEADQAGCVMRELRAHQRPAFCCYTGEQTAAPLYEVAFAAAHADNAARGRRNATRAILDALDSVRLDAAGRCYDCGVEEDGAYLFGCACCEVEGVEDVRRCAECYDSIPFHQTPPDAPDGATLAELVSTGERYDPRLTGRGVRGKIGGNTLECMRCGRTESGQTAAAISAALDARCRVALDCGNGHNASLWPPAFGGPARAWCACGASVEAASVEAARAALDALHR